MEVITAALMRITDVCKWLKIKGKVESEDLSLIMSECEIWRIEGDPKSLFYFKSEDLKKILDENLYRQMTADLITYLMTQKVETLNQNK